MSQHYFAYVFFRQKPDPTIRRGFYQKSVVLVSQIAAHDLFLYLMRSLGHIILERGVSVIETILEQSRQWPTPRVGKLEFPILGKKITCEIHRPWQETLPSQILTKPRNVPLLVPTFLDMVQKLWTLWEIMIIGDPIAIIAHCPSICTKAVLGLMSLILPISVTIDYRTYITMQDPNSKSLFKCSTPTNTIVAISNPFFFPSLHHWPHVIQLTPSSNRTQMLPTMKIEFENGLTSKHRRIVSRDKTVLTEITRGLFKSSKTSISARLERHFYELTEKFLMPIKLYLETLWPSSLYSIF